MASILVFVTIYIHDISQEDYFFFNYQIYCSFQLIKGTGPSGEVRAADVESFTPSAAAAAPSVVTTAPAAAAPPRPVAAPGATYVDIPLSNMRKVGLTHIFYELFFCE